MAADDLKLSLARQHSSQFISCETVIRNILNRLLI
jgi:hypothetical protein